MCLLPYLCHVATNADHVSIEDCHVARNADHVAIDACHVVINADHVSIEDYHVAINADHVALDACHVVINAGQTHHIFSAQASRSGANSIRVCSGRPNCSYANLQWSIDTQLQLQLLEPTTAATGKQYRNPHWIPSV